MHIELTEMLRCPEAHDEAFLVMSTGEMLGRMVRSGLLGCPICRREFPIVKGIVENHGGRIHVRSSPGKGTIFRIVFPVLAPENARRH